MLNNILSRCKKIEIIIYILLIDKQIFY